MNCGETCLHIAWDVFPSTWDMYHRKRPVCSTPHFEVHTFFPSHVCTKGSRPDKETPWWRWSPKSMTYDTKCYDDQRSACFHHASGTVDLAIILVHLDQHSDLTVTRLITDCHYLKEVKAPDNDVRHHGDSAKSSRRRAFFYGYFRYRGSSILNQRMQVYCAISQKRLVANGSGSTAPSQQAQIYIRTYI